MSLVAQQPTQELIDLVHALRGHWSGWRAMCLCPAHDDSSPSLSLRQGERGILVHCFAGCSAENVLRELQRVRIFERGRPPEAKTSIPSGNPSRLWAEGLDVRGTLAEAYCGIRHFHILPSDIRFHPRCPYRPRPHTVYLPALLVAVREGRRLTAIQRIFLDPKTGRYTHKRMLGLPARGAWQGSRVSDTLAIAEGFETAWAYTLLHDIPCWASLGADRFDQLIIPHSVTKLILAEDNDAPGLLAGNKAELRYQRPALQIVRCPPASPADDWAKVLKSQARQKTAEDIRVR